MSEVNSQQPMNSVATLVEKYTEGKRDFSRAELGNANLQGVNLKGADLSQANLSDADLRGALLISANLRDADLRGAHLEKADYDRSTHFPQDFDPVKADMQIRDD